MKKIKDLKVNEIVRIHNQDYRVISDEFGKCTLQFINEFPEEYLTGNDPEKIAALQAQCEAAELTNAKIQGVPSSKEFKKLQKDNAKLAKRIKAIEETLFDTARWTGKSLIDIPSEFKFDKD